MLSRARHLTISAAILAVLSASVGAYAIAADNPGAQVSAEADMPFVVEDFAYPGAAQVLKDKGIKLVSGDGHITLVDCDDTAPQIRVMSVKDPAVNRDGVYCFKAHANTGQLSLELPRVFAIEAADHPISADLTAEGTTKTVTLPKDGYESVGEGTVGGHRSVLVEIRVTG
ncbi:hypothetical protein NLX86_14280 [Streptomyces sp. A3M-1-3]|uniref:hypothetical protein n=1 Tax=Streptomyces sp. A3M-1-3 TaxID=2962044 RepID=UPI0020B88E4B|nr:hypothetical protein [Streptomyces sp. A3M-1-3]MCP3819228.1 hypothetical protein [Streptomyces sp. A3M-1-3]